MEGRESIAVKSPKDRLKFVSSYGGKILPRPSDGQLKYVGGDTRVFAFPRSVSFSEVMEKLTNAYAAEVVIKYQMMPEDLDALISVKSDEDFSHMVDEYDRQELSGSRRFRLYLFPSKINDQCSHHKCQLNTLERRYIDAINNVHVNLRDASSSTGSSPTSTTTGDSASFGFTRPLHKVSSSPCFGVAGAMHKAHSSPNLHALGKQAASARSHHHHYQQHSRTHKLRQNFSPGPPSPPCGHEMNPVNSQRPQRYTKPLTSTRPHYEEFCGCCRCCSLRHHQ